MVDITISDKKTEEPKPENIKDTIQKIDEIQKLKEENDILEAEIKRREELHARLAVGGRALAGQPNEISEEEKASKEAKELLSTYR